MKYTREAHASVALSLAIIGGMLSKRGSIFGIPLLLCSAAASVLSLLERRRSR